MPKQSNIKLSTAFSNEDLLRALSIYDSLSRRITILFNFKLANSEDFHGCTVSSEAAAEPDSCRISIEFPDRDIALMFYYAFDPDDKWGIYASLQKSENNSANRPPRCYVEGATEIVELAVKIQQDFSTQLNVSPTYVNPRIGNLEQLVKEVLKQAGVEWEVASSNSSDMVFTPERPCQFSSPSCS